MRSHSRKAFITFLAAITFLGLTSYAYAYDEEGAEIQNSYLHESVISVDEELLVNSLLHGKDDAIERISNANLYNDFVDITPEIKCKPMCVRDNNKGHIRLDLDEPSIVRFVFDRDYSESTKAILHISLFGSNDWSDQSKWDNNSRWNWSIEHDEMHVDFNGLVMEEGLWFLTLSGYADNVTVYYEPIPVSALINSTFPEDVEFDIESEINDTISECDYMVDGVYFFGSLFDPVISSKSNGIFFHREDTDILSFTVDQTSEVGFDLMAVSGIGYEVLDEFGCTLKFDASDSDFEGLLAGESEDGWGDYPYFISCGVLPPGNYFLKLNALSNDGWSLKYFVRLRTTALKGGETPTEQPLTRRVSIKVSSGCGSTLPSPGVYNVDKRDTFTIAFEPEEGYVPYRIWVNGIEASASPTLVGWILPASWTDQTFEIEYRQIEVDIDPGEDNAIGDKTVINIENLVYVKDITQLSVYINGNLSVSIPEMVFDGSAVRPVIVIAPMLTNEQLAELALPSGTVDIGVYRYTLTTVDGERPDVAEVVTFGADGDCLTTNMFAKFSSEQKAKEFVAKVRSDYGSDFLKGAVDGETAHVQVSMVGSRLDKATYERRLSEVVEGLEKGPVEGEDYVVTYANNDKPGMAIVTVTGKGEYYGTQTAQFKIVERSNDDSGSISGSGSGLAGGAAGTGVTGSASNSSKVTSTTTPLVQTGASTAGSSTGGKTGLVQTGDAIGYGAALLAVIAAVVAVAMARRRKAGAVVATAAPAISVPVFAPQALRMPAPSAPIPKKPQLSRMLGSFGAKPSASTGVEPSVALSPKMTCDVICSLDDIFKQDRAKRR